MATNAKTEVDKLLDECGATLLRGKKHQVYLLPNGQKFTRGSTPSDDRADLNSMSDLKRLLGLTKTVAVEGARREKKTTNGKAAPKPRYTRTSDATLAEKLQLCGAGEIALREQIAKLEETLKRRTAYAQERETEANHLRGMLKLSVRENQTRRSEMLSCLGCRVRSWWQRRRRAKPKIQETKTAASAATTV